MIGHNEMNKDFLNVIEKSRELMFFINKNGDIVHSTTAVQQLFGFSNYEYTAFNILDIIHPDDQNEVKDQMEKILSSPYDPINFIVRNRNKQGTYCWVEGTVTNMLDDEGITSIVSKFQDATERKANEQKQFSIIKDLTQRNEELNQFVYIISHNLRTPVANLIGLMNILETDQLDDYNKGILDLFKCATDRLSETIFDLTHILSLKDNQGVKISRINVQQVFEKVCLSFSEQFSQLGIKLVADFNCKSIIFNKSYLESILTNLVSNAIKYRDPNRQLEIGISLKKEDKNCILTFSDNGIGIDIDSYKDELFGLHQRFHNHINGNGVGLFITKSQITSLGGSIEVNSKVNEGTTFIITIKNDLAD